MISELTPPLDGSIQDCLIKFQHLRDAIAVGDKAISRDESQLFSSIEDLDSFFDQL